MSYNSRNRSSSSFGKASDDQAAEDHWLKELENSLEKSAVKSRDDDYSLFHQINSVISGTKPKYSSVAAAVEEMKERSGLTAYLSKINKISEQENDGKVASVNKQAQAVSHDSPELFVQYPQVKKTFLNYIEDTKGNISVPGILYKVRNIHEQDVANHSLWDDENLLRFITSENLKAKSENSFNKPTEDNLGFTDRGNEHIDPENYDAFYGLDSNNS